MRFLSTSLAGLKSPTLEVSCAFGMANGIYLGRISARYSLNCCLAEILDLSPAFQQPVEFFSILRVLCIRRGTLQQADCRACFICISRYPFFDDGCSLSGVNALGGVAKRVVAPVVECHVLHTSSDLGAVAGALGCYLVVAGLVLIGILVMEVWKARRSGEFLCIPVILLEVQLSVEVWTQILEYDIIQV